MRIEPEIGGVTVVLLGEFTPSILTPAWFALHGLLQPSVAETADLRVAKKELTAFQVDWLLLHASAERLQVEALQPPYVQVCDLIARVFKEQLPNSPIRGLGINRHVHFPVRGYDQYDRIGKKLAPVEPWGSLGEKLGLHQEHGGMTSLTMSQLKPEGRPMGGQINITVQPSVRIGEGRIGVYVGINDHFDIDSASNKNAKHAMHLLETEFDTSLARGDQIVDQIMSIAED